MGVNLLPGNICWLGFSSAANITLCQPNSLQVQCEIGVREIDVHRIRKVMERRGGKTRWWNAAVTQVSRVNEQVLGVMEVVILYDVDPPHLGRKSEKESRRGHLPRTD